MRNSKNIFLSFVLMSLLYSCDSAMNNKNTHSEQVVPPPNDDLDLKIVSQEKVLKNGNNYEMHMSTDAPQSDDAVINLTLKNVSNKVITHFRVSVNCLNANESFSCQGSEEVPLASTAPPLRLQPGQEYSIGISVKEKDFTHWTTTVSSVYVAN